METIYLAGGCFWCTEAIFKTIRGVSLVVPGYIGGTVENPTYEQICTGTTGHAEAVRVDYFPQEIALADILDIFFEAHDPTTLHRQGNDVGTQYRSAIFYTNETQKGTIDQAIERAQMHHSDPIVTEILPATVFFEAEAYHKNYYAEHTTQPYCTLVISPKLEKVQKKFADKIA
jgi:peptide-methionine (S)-S-oxide reductase